MSPQSTIEVYGSPKVLVADDNPDLRALVRLHLEARGWVVSQAVDGLDALSSCRWSPPDLVVLDVQMPRLDGWGVLARLKVDPEIDHVPVIMLTDRCSPSDVVDGLHQGAHDYLAKPFAPAELCARADAALRVKRLADELRRHNEELSQVSRTDWLTGLPNRRRVEERLIERSSAARRHLQDLALIMLDIDKFKDVNDELGHPAGDAVLRQVACRLRSVIRMEDMVGRWGGDEFAVVLPCTDPQRSKAVAVRLRAAVAVAPIDAGGGQLRQVRVSAGCASGSDVETVVAAADRALYEAKRAGSR